MFVDIDPASLNIDPDAVAGAVTSRTKAIFAVHYAGFPADMDRLGDIARAHGLMLVEDAAQALGSTWKGRPAGSLGDMATFSFHETKNIISGEGGALTLMRPELIERAEIIREKGTNRSRFLRGQVDNYTWVDLGSSFLPGELIAAFLHAQLDQAEAIRARRRAMFDRYRAAFADLAADGRVELPRLPEGATGNGHMFYLLLRDGADRDDFIALMRGGDPDALSLRPAAFRTRDPQDTLRVRRLNHQRRQYALLRRRRQRPCPAWACSTSALRSASSLDCAGSTAGWWITGGNAIIAPREAVAQGQSASPEMGVDAAASAAAPRADTA